MPETREALKRRACEAIDRRRNEIVAIGETIWRSPEVGFKEFGTARLVASALKQLGLECEEGIGITGVLTKVMGRIGRPNVAVMGELDSLIIPEHPDADRVTGAVHACGHHAQIANLLGTAFGLVDSGVMSELDGSVALMAVPAEEPIDIGWRQLMRERGEIYFTGGKQEFIRAGKLDDVDLAIMGHLSSSTECKVSVDASDERGPGMDGFVAKIAAFKGKEAHAGVAPEEGINALNAALLALMCMHVQRETFKGQDTVRVHHIISKGGDALNIVPADVRVEIMVRAATVDAIKSASRKVNRALQAGAMAVGAEVEVIEIPGYLPSGGEGGGELARALRDNMIALLGQDQVGPKPSGPAFVRIPSGGVSDGNDVANLMPVGSMLVNAAAGVLHGRDYQTGDKELAYVTPAKGYAMTIVDLLYGGAELARRVVDGYKPAVARESYLDYWRDIMSET